MVIMETPKTCKLRKVKGSLKKKKRAYDDRLPESRIEKTHDAQTSAASTPPRTSTIIERGQREVEGVEWQYHGKFVESDIPVVWGSPHGSPVVNTVKTVGESPVRIPRRKSPRSTSKKSNSTDSEPPQFLNEILALSEKIKAEEKNHDQLVASPVNEEQDCTGKSNTGHELDESFSKFFDEDGNDCLLQYSQELEKTSYNIELSACNKPMKDTTNEAQKKLCVMNSKISPQRKFLTDLSSKSLSCKSTAVFHSKDIVKEVKVKSPRVGNKNYVQSKCKTNTYVFHGRVLGLRSSGNAQAISECEQTKLDGNTQRNKTSIVSMFQTNIHKTEKALKPSKSHTSLDNSFETIKESFLNDDLEFLSTIPDDLEMVSTEKTKFGKTEFLPKKPSEVLERNQQKQGSQKVSSVLEDSTYFGEGVLQHLDRIETNVVPSQPLRCTPEEIERKRQEAKLKLQRKNLLMKK